MININTLVASYHFGSKLAETPFGRKFHLRYKDIKNKLSPETWNLYLDAIKKFTFQHYFSFDLAYKKIKDICSGKEEYFQESFIELQNCSELHTLIEEGNQIGRDLEDSLNQMFASIPTKSTSGIFDSLDLYRAWMDVFYQMHSTKLFSYLHQHKANIQNKQGNVQKFIKSKEIYPFSRQNRILIRNLTNKRSDIDIMYSVEFFDSLRNSILQVIFETHLNYHLRLNKNEISNFREKEQNKVRVFSTKLIGADAFKYQGNFIMFIEDNILQDIGLIRRRVGRYLELNERFITTIEGTLYPKTDYHLLAIGVPT